MKKFIGIIGLAVVSILAIVLFGYSQDRTVEKYQAAKRIAEEKLSRFLDALEQLPKDQVDSESLLPEFEKVNKLRKEFEEAFVKVTLFMPEEYVWDHDHWAKGILRKLKEMGLR